MSTTTGLTQSAINMGPGCRTNPECGRNVNVKVLGITLVNTYVYCNPCFDNYARRERLERERPEKERLEREMLEREKQQGARLEREWLERERLERERLERERLERERQEWQEQEMRAKGSLANQLETTKLTQELKKKALFCSIHQGKLNDPQTLPCLHTFCKACLQGLVSLGNHLGPLRCPLCQSEFAVHHQRSGNQGTFPALYFTQNYLNTSKVNPNEIQVTCACKKEALWYSPDFREYICEGCKTSGKGAGHPIISLEEAFFRERKAFCAEHHVELNTLCKTCDVVICSTCSVQYHNGHSLAYLSSEELAHFKWDIKDYWIQGKMREEELGKKIDGSRKNKGTFDLNNLKAEEEIKRSFENLHRRVDQRQQELLAQLKEKGKGKERNLALEREKLEIENRSVQALVEFTEILYLEGTDMEIAATKKQVETRMKTLKEMKMETETQSSPSIGFDPINQDQLQRALDSFGSITL